MDVADIHGARYADYNHMLNLLVVGASGLI